MKSLFKAGTTQASAHNNSGSGGGMPSQRQRQHQDSEQQMQMIERLRVEIPNAHVFKLPPKSGAGGWRGADWREKVWQGTVKVVERRQEQGLAEEATILLVDRTSSNIFAVCPVTGRTGAVDRCVDSSRYFVLRIENAAGRHMFIGLAFNERNDAFDFNTALEDSRREKEAEKAAARGNMDVGSHKQDYSIKDGQKIRIALPKNTLFSSTEENNDSPDGSAAARRRARQRRNDSQSANSSGGLLKPSSKDTPSHRDNSSSLPPAENKPTSILRKFF